MEGINFGRVVVGGLLAGLIINIGEFILNVPLIGAEFEEVVTSMNREPPGDSAIMIFVLMGFALAHLGGVALRRDPSAPRRRRENRSLCRLNGLGAGLSLPEFEFHGDGLLPDETSLDCHRLGLFRGYVGDGGRGLALQRVIEDLHNHSIS